MRFGSVKTVENRTAPYPHRSKVLHFKDPRLGRGSVRCGAVPCGTSVKQSYGAVRCGFVESKIIRCGAVR